MLFLSPRRLFAVALTILVSGCSLGSQQPLAVPNSQQPSDVTSSRAVSVFADTEEGLVRQIAAAKAAGVTPRFITIKGPQGTHLFPVYAVVARKGRQLLVLAYKKLYVFSAHSARVYYPDNGHLISAAALPVIHEEDGRSVGRCEKCMSTVSSAAILKQMAKQMASLQDPWQQTAAYTPWAATPKDSANRALSPALTTIVTVTATGGGSGGGGSGGTGGGCGTNKLVERAGRIGPNSVCTGGGGGGGAGGANELVAYPGKPQPGQTCDSSKPIGDLVGRVNQNGTATPEYIANINAIVGYGTPTIVNPGTVAIDTPVWGWIYKDGDGHFWVQVNANAGQPWTAGITAWFLSVGISSPTETTPHYYGNTPPPTKQDETNETCWPDSNSAWA